MNVSWREIFFTKDDVDRKNMKTKDTDNDDSFSITKPHSYTVF